MIPHPLLAEALENLLEKPGVAGHSLSEPSTLRHQATYDLIETRPRNLSLREVYLAMGLLFNGDPNGFGHYFLQSYSHDLRGHFARYAQALLAEKKSQGSPPPTCLTI